MSKFTGYGRTNHIDFGDYVKIEMHRYYSENEMFVHKVVGALKSNVWIDTPLRWDSKPTRHDHMEVVLNVVQCGVNESEIIRVRESDCIKMDVECDEIRRLREENERLNTHLKEIKEDYRIEHFRIENGRLASRVAELEKQLQGIGAEQYYSMRQKYWDEQKKTKELAEVLRKLSPNVVYKALRHYDKQSLYKESEFIELHVAREWQPKIDEVLRKYGLEEEQ